MITYAICPYCGHKNILADEPDLCEHFIDAHADGFGFSPNDGFSSTTTVVDFVQEEGD